MTAAPRYLESNTNELLTGHVVLCQGATFSVTLEQPSAAALHMRSTTSWARTGELLAKRAAGCLLAPRSRDRVLVALTPEPFILTVLERKGDQPAEIDVEGDLTVRAHSGRLELEGAEGVGMLSRETISMTSRALSMRSGSAELLANHIQTVAITAKVQLDKLSVMAQTYDQLAERIVQRAQRVYRYVEQYDQLRARYIDYRADQNAQLRGKSTMVTARQVLKIDGEQVHIG